MCTFLRFYLFLAFSLILVSCEKSKQDLRDLDQDNIMSEIELAYEYPIKPGTPEWDLLTDLQRVEACNIPEPILARLRTRELIEVILAYPLLDKLQESQSVPSGHMSLVENFNAVIELTQHERVANAFADVYKLRLNRVDALGQHYSEDAKKQFVQQISHIELLATRHLRSPLSSSFISKDDLKPLMSALLEGYEAKLESPLHFDQLALNTNRYARLKILLTSYFFNAPAYADILVFSDNDIELIDRLSQEFLQL